jgi:hypothetical protein
MYDSLTFHRLQKEDNFGQFGFFTNQKQDYIAKSNSKVTLYSIDREECVALMKKYFPLDFEKFCMIKDTIIFKRNLALINQKCCLCNKEGHFERDC